MRIKLLRVSRDLKQDEASKLIGVSDRTYQRWEQGDNYPIATCRKMIAAAFEVTESEIFDEDKGGE
jgi:DNA-binding XRE family transcriptional regulator